MGKIYNKNMGVYSIVLKKNETATMFFLKKPSLVYIIMIAYSGI